MGYKITIKQGNLLNESEATFIVNASNTRMILGSGVSMAFKRKYGLALQNEMSEKLNTLNKELEPGEIIKTSAINSSQFLNVLHVAIINYNKKSQIKQKNPTLHTIEKSLIEIEKHVSEFVKKEKSRRVKLVMPLMGCGVDGLNKRELITVYRDFFKRDQSFDCEVVIYGYTIEDYQIIEQIILNK